MSNIIAIRLNTSEEIIAKVSPVTSRVSLVEANRADDTFDQVFEDMKVGIIPDMELTLSDVRVITLQHAPNGRAVGISLLPFTLANPGCSHRCNLTKVASFVYSPEESLEHAYIGETSPIAMATAAEAAALNLQ